MRNKLVHIIWLIAFFLTYIGASQAMARTDYYVATNDERAKDTNTGLLTSLGFAPFKTIQHAVNVVTTPGDIIHVFEGVYNERITFTAQNKGIILDALPWNNEDTKVRQVYGFNTRNADSVVIRGFTIVNNANSPATDEDKCGIFVGSDGVILSNIMFDGIQGPAVLMDKAQPHTGTSMQDCYIDNCSQGIVAYGSNLSFSGNTIKHLMVYPGVTLNPVYLKLVGSNIAIERNRCYGTNSQDAKGSTVMLFDTSEAEGGANNLYFNQNVFKDYDVICDIQSVTANAISGILFENNIFAHGRKSGIALTGLITKVYLVNNLFYDIGSIDPANTYALLYKAGSATNPGSASYNYAINNICYNSGTQPIQIQTGASWTKEDYNLLYSASGTITPGGANDLVADPQFVDDAEKNNFHLNSTSPVIDRGVRPDSLFASPVGYFAGDFSYVPRPQGASSLWDIGPYESDPSMDSTIIPVIYGCTPKENIYNQHIFGDSAESYAGYVTYWDYWESKQWWYFQFDLSQSHFSSGSPIPFGSRYVGIIDFGDGTAFNGTGPVKKMYYKEGTYTLTAKIYDTVNHSVAIKAMTITIWPPNNWQLWPDYCLSLRMRMNKDIRDYTGYHQPNWVGAGGGYGAGVTGQALVFNGLSGGPYVVVPRCAYYAPLDNSYKMTLAFYAKKSAASASGVIMMKEGAYKIELQQQAVAATLYVTNDAGSSKTITLGPVQVNNNDTSWHHYCIVYDSYSATVKLYFDGEYKISQPIASIDTYLGGPSSYSTDLILGKDNVAGSATFNGSLDSVRIYVTALTDAEVATVYKGTQFGDATLNGTVSATDAAWAARYAIGSQSLTSKQLEQADASGDGKVSAYDASLIARYVVGSIQKLPADASYE